MAIKPPNQTMSGNSLNNSNGQTSGGATPPAGPNAMFMNGARNGTYPQGSHAGSINPPNGAMKFNPATSKMPVGNAATMPSSGAIPVSPGHGGGGGGAMASMYKRS